MKRASPPFDSLPTLPLASRTVIAGFRSLPRGVERQSMTSRLVMPVDSSAVSCTEMPSTRSSKATLPSISVRIGRVYGSHSAMRWPRFTLSPSSTIDARAVGDAVRRALLAGLVEDQDRHVAAHHHQLAVGVAHHVAVADRHRALVGGFQERRVDHLRGAAHVEGAHGELGARLADRLRGDDADRLADIDRRAARQIAAVADRADARPDLAGQRRTDAHATGCPPSRWHRRRARRSACRP